MPNRLLSDQGGRIARSLLVGLIGIILPAVVLIVIYSDRPTEQSRLAANPLAQEAPRIGLMMAPDKLGGRRLELFRLPGPLGAVPIYAIAIDDAAVWLGTGKGLIRFAPDGDSVQYRNFTKASHEWVRNLALVDGRIAASIMVASGNTGGTPVGTYLFDPATEQWQRIGVYARSLAANGSRIWALKGRSLSRITQQSDGRWQQQEVGLDQKLCSEGELTIAGGEVWIAQQGTVRHSGGGQQGASWARDVPCGVLRFDPQTARETLYEQQHGLASGFGRGIAADEHAVWVAHSIDGDGLSQFSLANQQWAPLPLALNSQAVDANVIGLSPAAIWLGTPDGRRPLVRLDRGSFEAQTIAEAPAEYYVSAIASRDGSTWVAMSQKLYQADSPEYQVRTLLGRLRE